MLQWAVWMEDDTLCVCGGEGDAAQAGRGGSKVNTASLSGAPSLPLLLMIQNTDEESLICLQTQTGDGCGGGDI